jgi:pimeloyl-ACP methyl ester carboxylesterase
LNIPAPFIIPTPQLLRTAAGVIELIDNGAGPTLLALHGGMGGYDQSWLLARSLLSPDENFRILAISRPGYLGTSLKLGATPEEQADLYAVLLDTLKIESALVAGISAGGPSALQFALRHPSRCKGLILVSAATGKLDMPERFHSQLKSMQLFSHIPGLPGLFRRGVLSHAEDAAKRALKDGELARATLAHPEAGPMLLAFQSGVFTKLSERIPGTMNDAGLCRTLVSPPFADLRVPVLVLHGTDDDVVPLIHGKAVAQAAPQARMEPLSGGGHTAIFSHLDAVRSAMRAFVDGIGLR